MVLKEYQVDITDHETGEDSSRFVKASSKSQAKSKVKKQLISEGFSSSEFTIENAQLSVQQVIKDKKNQRNI